MMRAAVAAWLISMASACHAAPAMIQASDARSPLPLERMIPLPGVKGRIDHLALDLDHRRLLVAEYGNGSVDEVDLATGRVAGRISGLHEPQGVAYLGREKEWVVACGDGSVHFYAAADRHEIARLDLGDDADNVRVDERNGHVVVGYGGGGLAVIDPANHRIISRMSLPGHPEGFRLISGRVLVNVPDRGSIIAGDIDKGTILSTWKTGAHRLNFPLIASPTGNWFAIAYRLPAALAQYDVDTGKELALRAVCGDADDLFVDGRRIYVICGAGHVDVLSTIIGPDPIRIATAAGARTGLFSPELHMLFVAEPARGKLASILMLDTDPKGR
jgi:hypothetical protein